MDLTKLKKDELIEQLEKANEKLTDMDMLKQAVEAKDKEMSILKKQCKIDIDRNKSDQEERIQTYRKELQELKASREQSIKEDSSKVPKEKVQELMKVHAQELEKIKGLLRSYVSNYRSLMKSMQGSLELSAELEYLTSQYLPKENEVK